VLAYPTETVYGLGSRATDGGLRVLAQLKGRPEGKPFLLLVGNRAMAEASGLAFTRAADALARVFWPGPLTLVLTPIGERLPRSLRGPEGGVAVRWTSHEGLQHLLAAVGEPLTSTSANRPGGPPAPGAAGVLELFPAQVATGELLVLDGGVLGNVPPSTIVDCTGPKPGLIREGAILRSELRHAVGALAP
jgi:L-threonylcarbamoyladenylate synthase